MPSNKTAISIDPTALAAARKVVADATSKRKAARRRKYQTLADNLMRLRALTKIRRKEAQNLRRKLPAEYAEAAKRTLEDQKLSTKFKVGRKMVAEQCGDRPLRLFIESHKALKPSDAQALIRKALKLSRRADGPTVEYLYPRIIKKSRDLRRFLVVDLRLNRRRGLPIGARLSDAIRRTGAFASVRIEGLRSGTLSGPPLTGTGPNYAMTRPDRLDWHLTDPTDAFLDSNPADGTDSIGAIDIYGAWEVLGANAGPQGAGAGAGIVIGHPDTGYLPHEDYPISQVDQVGAYDAFNFASAAFSQFAGLEGIGRHPLQPTTFPYIVQHGTYTASVIVAPQSRAERDGREMVGVAPGATILPLRCVDTVILAGDLELIRAIEHAIWSDVDVISISLGGAPNPALLQALQAAIENGIIVVAAAGQPGGEAPLPDQVVAPAAWAEVIAVGGSIGGHAWFGCFSGPEVDFCAPAVQVRRAGFETDGTELHASGNGTSFATAMTAGVAALWLQHHGGRSAIQQAVPGVSVQQVFRHLARETSYRPSDLQVVGTDTGWPAGYGSGVLNARKLLEAQLPSPADVPGYNRFLPPNVYVLGSGVAIFDLNGRPVLDGIIMLQNAPGAIASGIAAAGQVIGDFVADLTAGTSIGVNTAVATWLGAVGAVQNIGASAVNANALADAWAQSLAAAGSVGGELGEWLSDQAEQAEQAWSDAEDVLDEALEETEEALEDLVEDTSEFIEDTVEDAAETGAEIVEDVADLFSGLFG